MSSGDSFFESKKFKTIMKYVYGYGGAIVIIGAMFKIQHWPGATIMLIGGLGIEAVIFMLSAHEPLHEELDWTLAYPELALGHSDDDDSSASLPEKSDESVVEQLDNMLAKAKIEPELIESLGSGMRNLSENAGKLGDISSASDATNEYVENLKGASEKVDALGGAYEQASSQISEKANSLGEAYSKAASSIEEFTNMSGGDSNFGEQLDKVSSNLTQLNNLYEMQLEGVSSLSKASEDMSTGITSIVNNLQSSVEDTQKYKETMSDLTSNLAALNSVYGNMLSAMNVNK
ncbi:MAG: gliding motility protein GldL [Flavobacteriales bacterium]|jgi:gliding motility-associated protein GldL|nr:gliding motility protein GldL [Flavobacteriales bacterium]MDG1797206.1 gliding motility protein GldL [Flavobacteriales bacterium]